MRIGLLAALAVTVVAPAVAAPPDGTIVSREAVAFPSAEELAHFRANDPAYATAAAKLHVEAIIYMSDGLKVKELPIGGSGRAMR